MPAADDVRLTLRVPTDLHALLAQSARADQRSLNGQIVFLLRQTLAAATARRAARESLRSAPRLTFGPLKPPPRRPR
jgi:hypothetical protein